MKKYLTIEEYFKKQKQPAKKFNKQKIIIYILKLIFIGIIIFSFYVILNWIKDNFQIKQINKEIEENINLNSNNEVGELVNPPKNKKSNYYYYAKFPFYETNFSPLLEQNPDTVAFIYIKNTIISYPVVKASDNNYYLKHSFDKKYNSAGWVFMDYRNNNNYNLDDNTIIYGHARLDGTMFGSLKKVLTSSWQEEKDNYVIFLSTSKANMIFQIFSIYTIKKESYYIKTNFINNNEKQEWIDTMQKRNIAPITTEVNINDKFLTLSTCQNRQGGRIVVHAKLIKKQNNIAN